jgi:hypothetical protein
MQAYRKDTVDVRSGIVFVDGIVLYPRPNIVPECRSTFMAPNIVEGKP